MEFQNTGVGSSVDKMGSGKNPHSIRKGKPEKTTSLLSLCKGHTLTHTETNKTALLFTSLGKSYMM